jgi:hypothetical protein
MTVAIAMTATGFALLLVAGVIGSVIAAITRDEGNG